MAVPGLVEVDSIEIKVIVDNELDPITPSGNPAVQYHGLMQGQPLDPLPPGHDRGGAQAELKMENICCAAHGLSLMITATRGDTSHTLLFDTGPEASAWHRNATRLRADISRIEHVHLSHWHRDHSGGLLEALRMINAARQMFSPSSSPDANPEEKKQVTVDVHPDRPDYRGLSTPSGAIVSLQADPTLADIERAGATVVASAEAHPVLDGFFLASGAIPRRTAYELGIRGGLRFVRETGAWVADEAIADERLVVCRLRGKGLVVFTGCSHAGVINVCRHAIELAGGQEGGEGGGLTTAPSLHAVVGGFHLSDNNPEKLEKSVVDLMALEPRVLIPGHCTGWRFKAMCEAAMPGVVVPSFCGTTYTLAS